MDGMSILFAAIQILITALCVLVPVAMMLGRLKEKISQLEKRLGGNGYSVPSQCRVHEEKLDNHERRLGRLEEV